MGNTDSMPVVSQVKSTVQVVCGDTSGAARTQKNFLRECPGFSQVTSTVQLLAGDKDGAVETQKRCGKGLLNMADGLPVVGHAKGLVHYALGDEEGGDKAMKAATRTTGVMGGGVVGFLVGGPPGAVVGGIEAGALMDIGTTVVTGKPSGYIAAIENVVKNPNAGDIFDLAVTPVFDGLAGYAAGAEIVGNSPEYLEAKAEAMLDSADTAHSNGLINDWEYKQNTDNAATMYNKAQGLKGNKPPGNSLGYKEGQSGGQSQPGIAVEIPTYSQPSKSNASEKEETRLETSEKEETRLETSEKEETRLETSEKEETRSKTAEKEATRSKTSEKEETRSKTSVMEEPTSETAENEVEASTWGGDDERPWWMFDPRQQKERSKTSYNEEKWSKSSEKQETRSQTTERENKRPKTAKAGAASGGGDDERPWWIFNPREHYTEMNPTEFTRHETISLTYTDLNGHLREINLTQRLHVRFPVQIEKRHGRAPNRRSAVSQMITQMNNETWNVVAEAGIVGEPQTLISGLLEFIRGHLQSQDYGGLGDIRNIIPMTRSLNALFETRFESIIKDIRTKFLELFPNSLAFFEMEFRVYYITITADSGRKYPYAHKVRVNVSLGGTVTQQEQDFFTTFFPQLVNGGASGFKLRTSRANPTFLIRFWNTVREIFGDYDFSSQTVPQDEQEQLVSGENYEAEISADSESEVD